MTILTPLLFTNRNYHSMPPRRLLAIPLCFLFLGAQAQDRATDPLGPLTQCIGRSQFQFKKLDRLPARLTTRDVQTRAGMMQVSTVDGYRLILYRQSVEPLVNLKIERSAEGKFAADHQVLSTQMQELTVNSKTGQVVPLELGMRHGVEVLGLNSPSPAQASGVISLYTLMHAASGTVASIYMLGQPPASREFATDAEYQAIREQFIDVLAACMAAPH